jgi:hypothetical protein
MVLDYVMIKMLAIKTFKLLECDISVLLSSEFAKFVMNQELCRQQWLEAEKTCVEQSKRAKELEHDNQTLKTKLKHARLFLNVL